MRKHPKLAVLAAATLATTVGALVAVTSVGVGASGPTRTYPSSTCPQADGPAGGLEQCIATSAPGTTITVKPGVYFENDIDVDRKITIQGPCPSSGKDRDGRSSSSSSSSSSRAVIDAAPPRPPAVGARGDGFDVQANDVTIACLTIRHYDIFAVDADQTTGPVDNLRIDRLQTINGNNTGVGVAGNGYRIENSVFTGANNNAVETDGDNGRLLSNRARNIGNECFELTGNMLLVEGNTASLCEDAPGVLVTGNNNTIRKNTVSLADSDCFRIDGDDNQVLENRATNCEEAVDIGGAGNKIVSNTATGGFEQNGFRIEGDNSVVQKNTLTGFAPQRGFSIFGADPIVEANKAIGGSQDAGIRVDCFGASCNQGRVVGNSVEGSTNDASGIVAVISPSTPCTTFPCFRVVGNASTLNTERGYFLQMSLALISGNKATLNGSEDEDGIFIFGDDNLIEANIAKENAFDGFKLNGSGNTIRRNVAEMNGVDGIHLFNGAGNRLDRNTATSNEGDGIENDGTATVITGNVSKGNRADCVGDNAPASSSGNSCADGSDFVGDPGTVDE